MAIGKATEDSEHALFDLESYELYRADAEVPAAVSGEMLLSFPSVRQVDIQRAYVDHLNDRSISNQFRNLTDDEYWHRFWKVFDDDGFRSSDYGKYEEAFYLRTVLAWCESNGIVYRLSLR